MSTNITREEFENKAAAYALGAMSLHEVRVFEDLISSFDEDETLDLDELERSVAALAYTAAPAVPSSGVKEKLFAQINKDIEDKENPDEPLPMVAVRENEGDWIKFEKGVQIKFLFRDPYNKTVTTLMRLRPGSTLPRHKHAGVEQCYVIEGDMVLEGVTYNAGDFFCAMPGTIHEPITSTQGGLVLLVSPEHYEPVHA
jgi:quercetin dioxygenase-like cupin family protein